MPKGPSTLKRPPAAEEPPPPAPPPCSNHPRSLSAWRCQTCNTALCDTCVRVYRSKEVKLASCKKCKAMCKAVVEERYVRPGAETPEEAEARGRRDLKLPAMISAVSAGLFLLAAAWYAPHDKRLWTMAAVVPWAAVSGAILAAVFHFSPAEFDSRRTLLLKCLAFATAVQASRYVTFHLFHVEQPSGGLEVLALLLPFSVSYVLVPFGVTAVLVKTLFADLSSSEKMLLITYVFLGSVFAFAMLKLAGLPG